jgi:endonuclease/exonuclease/phosphatase family metal-dependent hydrolase
LLAKRTSTSTTPRVGTWNIRFFPDHEAEPTEEDDGTDVAWLACAIASLDVQLLLVQEFKLTEESLQKQKDLIAGLNGHTGGDWRLELATCQPAEVQHPGFLYDASRVTASNLREVSILNPNTECSNEVSPGFAGYFSIKGGPDFHAVVVHMHTGEAATSVEKRAQSIAAMVPARNEAVALVPDNDIFFAGDFNTSGCDKCSPALSSEQEIANISQTLSTFDPVFRLLPASERCSREDGSNSHLLDHFAVAASMQEIPEGTIAHVSGLCEAIQCDGDRYLDLEARDNLSDHCPVLVDLAASDDD